MHVCKAVPTRLLWLVFCSMNRGCIPVATNYYTSDVDGDFSPVTEQRNRQVAASPRSMCKLLSSITKIQSCFWLASLINLDIISACHYEMRRVEWLHMIFVKTAESLTCIFVYTCVHTCICVYICIRTYSSEEFNHLHA